MKCKALLVVLTFILTLPVCAQKVKTVEGEYTYIMPGNEALNVARTTAIERAKIDALAKEFGTIVSQSNTVMISNENARSKGSFYSLGGSEVKGEWIETLSEKTEERVEDGKLVVFATVKGKAREVNFAKVDIDVKLLRNGKNDDNEAEEFKDGNRFYVSFRSPANGYLNVYLLDAERNAYRIMPFDDEELCVVRRNHRYLFIDDPDKELFLTCAGEQEINQVYIVFSPNKFYSGLDVDITDNSDLEAYKTKKFKKVEHLPYLPFLQFQKWLVDLRKKDPEVQVVTKFIKITK
jgi:hypothetical protein